MVITGSDSVGTFCMAVGQAANPFYDDQHHQRHHVGGVQLAAFNFLLSMAPVIYAHAIQLSTRWPSPWQLPPVRLWAA